MYICKIKLKQSLILKKTKNMNTNEIQEIEKRINQKITIFKHNDFGFPSTVKCTLNEVKVKGYAQYKDSLFLIFTPKGKRTKYQVILKGYESILIYDDHIDLNAEMYTEIINEDMKQSEVGFSNNYFKNALNSTEKTPFLNLVKQ